MKRPILLLIFLSINACSPPPASQPQKIVEEDYVLIEFASKLEEDFHRIQNVPIHAPHSRHGREQLPLEEEQQEYNPHGH